MGLSIIVPIYQESKFLEKFLHRLSKQTKKNYEVVFVIDTNNEKCLKLIDKFNDLIKGDMKVLYNSKRQGRYKALKKGVELINKKHVIIISITDVFKDDLVEKINKIILSNNADIIEFNARSHSPIWFNGYPRTQMQTIQQKTKIEKKLDIFAYTYPFEFNKVIRTNVIKKAIALPKINMLNSNSRFAIELIFKCILISDSYYTLNQKIVRSKKINRKNYNPINILKEWDKIIENELFSLYHEAIEYNKYFSSKIFYQAYIKPLKNNNIQIKFNDQLKKFNDKDFYDSNIYFLKNNKETNILKQYKNINSYKAYKEL